jgi:GNAT superfamily N-acetyltransferase
MPALNGIFLHLEFHQCLYTLLVAIFVIKLLFVLHACFALESNADSGSHVHHHRTHFQAVQNMDQKTFTAIVVYMNQVVNNYGGGHANMGPYVFSMDYVAYCTHGHKIVAVAFIRKSTWVLKPRHKRDEKYGGCDTLYSNWLSISLPETPIPSREQPNAFYTWNVRGLCVLPKYRRLGVATALLKMILGHARDHYIVHVELHVDKEPARGCAWKVQMYQNLGFCVLPERTEDYHLVWMNPRLL